MKTDLSHLPEHKQNELKSIVAALIPRYSEVEMIILFGSYARGTWVEDKYVEKGNTYEYKSDYDLLVILGKNGQAQSDTLTQSINTRLNELKLDTPVHPIFHGIEFVNRELQEGNYFFGDIKKEGILLFNTSRYKLDDKRDMSSLEMKAKAQRVLIIGLIVPTAFINNLITPLMIVIIRLLHFFFIRRPSAIMEQFN